MRLAIMQPYFLPYIGYFQLIGAVDTFVDIIKNALISTHCSAKYYKS